MAYDNSNSGVISKNKRKTEDKHPDITGQATIDGVEYYIDGYQRKRNEDGSPFYSLKFKPKGDRR